LQVRNLLCFLLVWCFGWQLSAQRIQYDLRGCTLTVDDKAKFQSVAEYETAFFSEVFGVQRKQTIRVRMYGDEQDFRRAQRKIVGRVISSTGIYAPLPKLVLVNKWSRYLATTYHEMSHAVFHHHARFRPEWLDEGTAEYFKGAIIDSAGNIAIGTIAYRHAEMKTFVSDSAFSIRKTISASYRRFHGRHEHKYYTMSWGIVYFLRTEHDDVFRTIMYHVGTGSRSEKIIEAEYPGGIAQLEKDMIRFYQ
jgi:hypothetical protein